MILLLYSNNKTSENINNMLEIVLHEIRTTEYKNKIYIIRTDKDEIRNWLVNNTSGIIVNNVPCFLIRDKNKNIKKYDIYNWDFIKRLID